MGEREFSELLGHYIQESGYTNYEFARVVGINRVNIQRYLAGARVPNRQKFEKIADELHLGNREWEEFFESYQCAFDGKDIYYMKKAIRDILENSAAMCGMEKGLVVAEGITSEKEIEVIQGRTALEKYIWSLFYHVSYHASQSDHEQKIYCFVPADRMMLGKAFPTLQKEGEAVLCKVKIVHLVQLAKRADLFKDHYHNLCVIRNLIPAYYQAGNRYETLYYYCENPQLEMNDGLLYPYYIVFEDRVLLLDASLEKALSIKKPEIVEPYLELIKKRIRGGYKKTG